MNNNEIIDDLAIFQSEDIEIENVDVTTRFYNFLVDKIILYVINFIIMLSIFFDSDSYILSYLVGAFVAIIYYTILEGSTKGKSAGKFLTKTRAIKNDGNNITYHEAFSRALSRVVPLEPFSFLFYGNIGWHDKWTDTSVISEDDYQKIRNKQLNAV